MGVAKAQLLLTYATAHTSKIEASGFRNGPGDLGGGTAEHETNLKASEQTNG